MAFVSMESPLSPFHVIIAYDATKDRSEHELNLTVDSVRLRGDILRGGDTLIVLGVLHKVLHPLGYQLKVGHDTFGASSIRAMEEDVSRKVELYVNMLLDSAQVCEDEGVNIEVKVTAGNPTKKVILQEVAACNASWVILDRHLRKDLRFFLQQIPCKLAIIQDNLSLEVLRYHRTDEADVIQHVNFYSMSKPVPLTHSEGSENIQQSVISCPSFSASIDSQQSSEMLKRDAMLSSAYRSRDNSSSLDFGSSSKKDIPGMNAKVVKKIPTAQLVQKQHKTSSNQGSSEAPILCATCGIRSELYTNNSMKFSFSEIQTATNEFSKDNLLGEGGYGHVYKGKLKDGQLIAAKVRKEASTQGFVEFNSEVYVLSFARHKNIVMLLGYCCKENYNILVYEYICNKSLDWHLFDKTESILQLHQRLAIAIGTAKGLCFLHEECRGGPIIHRDMRPSNILLTHDLVPMLGDFGLAKWKTSNDPLHTRVLGTLGYLAPEYAETGIISVRTDVYAFGIVLLQLISGRKVVDENKGDQQQSLCQWAEPLIEKLALHELIDPRLEDSYDTYELYLMAKAAYFCVQRGPEMRPSMGEVVRLLESANDRYRCHGEQSMPKYPSS